MPQKRVARRSRRGNEAMGTSQNHERRSPIIGNIVPVFRLALVVICAVVPALGQQCPRTNPKGPPTASEPRTLEGRLVYHDGSRQWFELKLDKPQCGQASTELVRRDRDWVSLEVLRGCRVRSRGTIDFSPTGYYSLETFQDVDEIEPVGPCARQSPLPDYSRAKPDKAIRAYRVEMDVDYRPGDHPFELPGAERGRGSRILASAIPKLGASTRSMMP